MPESFAIDMSENKMNLINTIKVKEDSERKCQAWLAFLHLTKCDQQARKKFFSLSVPGHHPRYWFAIVDACSDELNRLISVFHGSVDRANRIPIEAARKQAEQLSLKNSESYQFNPRLNQHNPGSTQHNPGLSQPYLGSTQNSPRLNQPYPGSTQNNTGLNQPYSGSTQNNPGLSQPYLGSTQNNPGLNQPTPGFKNGTTAYQTSPKPAGRDQPFTTYNNFEMRPVYTSTPIGHAPTEGGLVQRRVTEGNGVRRMIGVPEEEGVVRGRGEGLVYRPMRPEEKTLMWGVRMRVEGCKWWVVTAMRCRKDMIIDRLKHIWLYVYFCEEIPKHQRTLVFEYTQKYFWIIGGLTNLICASREEDNFGVVQSRLVEIIQLLFSLQEAMELWQISNKCNLYSNSELGKKEIFLTTQLNLSVRRIAHVFKESLLTLNLKPEVQVKLKAIIFNNY